MIEITSANGQIKHVVIERFTALTGWEMQQRFLEFAASTDSNFRKKFTMEVLSYAKVHFNDRELPLTTDDLINNHLETWQNVEMVFEAVLLDNGIDPKTHANRPHFWADAGAEMAVAFIAETSKLLGPAFQMMDQGKATPGE